MSQPAKVAVVVCVGVFLSSLDLFIVNIAFPDLRRDFPGSSLAQLSWVLNVYDMVFAALLVPAGRWADRAGHKRAFLAGLALFMIASAACAAAPSVEFLIGARVVQAAGAALMLPTSLALLLPEFPPHRRQIAVGIWAATGGAAAAAGPPIGGLLVAGSWRLVFLVNVPLVLAALAIGAKVLRESRDPAGARPDAAGAALLAGGIGALALAIVEGPDWGWGSARVVALLAASVLLVAAVAARSTRHPAPVVAGAAQGSRLRVRRRGDRRLLYGLRSDAARHGSVRHDGLGRADPDGGPDARPRTGDGRRPVRARLAGRPARRPAERRCRRHAVLRAGRAVVAHPHVGDPRLRDRPAAVAGPRRHRRRPDAPQRPGCGHRHPAAVAPCHRHRGADHGQADRDGAGRGDPHRDRRTSGGGEAVSAFKDAWVFVVGTAVTASLAMVAAGGRAAEARPAAQPVELVA